MSDNAQMARVVTNFAILPNFRGKVNTAVVDKKGKNVVYRGNPLYDWEAMKIGSEDTVYDGALWAL